MTDKKIIYPEKPTWEPLEKAIGSQYKEFMFMGKVAVGEIWIFLYKHINTRRYLNLDGAGRAYQYKDSKYSPLDLSAAIDHAFA